MIHALKTEKIFFEDVVAGLKLFEIRKNDRHFDVGDFLALNEVVTDPNPGPQPENEDALVMYTGRCVLVLVTYILTDPRFVPNGLCVMGIRATRIGVQAFEECFAGGAPYNCHIYNKSSFIKAGGQSDGNRA